MKLPFVSLSVASVQSATLAGSPVHKVVELIIKLKAGIEGDGIKEQQSYDKYACWCEKTLARKVNAINDGKKLIEKLQTAIFKLKGDIGAHKAEIEQLGKDIKENEGSQREATEARSKENEEYEQSKQENEQCIGALEMAIKVLTGAGTGKGFLQMQEASLLSVVGGVRSVLEKPLVSDVISLQDVEMVRKFVESPESFMGRTGTSALQVEKGNPFGEYAPQSTVISGILKGMYDAFTSDLEKSNAGEADSQKGYEELIATKQKELNTLETTLEKQEKDKAVKSKELSDSKTTKDDTATQVDADEDFFEETKGACKTKATEWAERSRLRSEELQGIVQAIDILNSPESRATFDSSATTFLQFAVNKQASHARSARSHSYAKLRSLAQKYNDQTLHEVAVEMKLGGHFDKVFVMIDTMIASLRKEEQADIDHRDRCQNAGGKNKNDNADLEHDITKAGDEILLLQDRETDLKGTIVSLKNDIKDSKYAVRELTDMRNSESKNFKKALKDDTAAVAIIETAIVTLSKFYKSNKIPMSLTQRDPEYTVDEDKAPETSWGEEGGAYGGRKGESTGIIAIMAMIKEDTENEIKTSMADDKQAQADYLKDRRAVEKTLDAQLASKVQAEKELAATEVKIEDTQEEKAAHAADLQEGKALAATLGSDCKWVKTHFDSRREKRKAEIDGLNEAKNSLAGSNYDDDGI